MHRKSLEIINQKYSSSYEAYFSLFVYLLALRKHYAFGPALSVSEFILLPEDKLQNGGNGKWGKGFSLTIPESGH